MIFVVAPVNCVHGRDTSLYYFPSVCERTVQELYFRRNPLYWKSPLIDLGYPLEWKFYELLGADQYVGKKEHCHIHYWHTVPFVAHDVHRAADKQGKSSSVWNICKKIKHCLMTFNIFLDWTREEISTKSTSTAVFSFSMAGSISMNSFTYVRGCQAKICTEKDKHSYKGNF